MPEETLGTKAARVSRLRVAALIKISLPDSAAETARSRTKGTRAADKATRVEHKGDQNGLDVATIASVSSRFFGTNAVMAKAVTAFL
jgi:hypothetical protein